MNGAYARYPVRWVSLPGGFLATPRFAKEQYVGGAHADSTYGQSNTMPLIPPGAWGNSGVFCLP
jgi:hypothetical protein